MESAAQAEVLTDSDDPALLSLIGRAPDSALDVERLRRIADGLHVEEVADFCRTIRTSDLHREAPLRDLLQGLELVEPDSFWDLLDSRAVNVLRRSEFASWSALCGASACAIEGLHGAGPRVVDSTVAGMAKEWANAYLRRWGVPDATAKPEPAHRLRPADSPVGLGEMDAAFKRLEAQPGFRVLAVRLGRQGPTHRELAQASGRSIQAVSAQKSRIQRHLHRQMRDPTWPVGAAVRHLEARIGSLALPSETDSLLAALHRDSGALGRDKPHRRVLHSLARRLRGDRRLGVEPGPRPNHQDSFRGARRRRFS